MREWLQKRLDALGRQQGYVKPEMGRDAVKMDSNENFVVPKSMQQEMLRASRETDIREYPLGGAERLASAIAGHLGVPPPCVGVGNGSDQILDLILTNFATRKTRVLAPDPTFTFFEQRCRLYSVPMARVPFTDEMTLDADAFVEASKDADIIYIDSPNNPTGFQFPKKDMLRIIRGFDGMVIVDEAYGDFAEYSLARTAARRSGLIVVRTFSKSHGLAGLRLGYFVATRSFARVFNDVVQYPYPVNSLAVEAGMRALSKSKQMHGVADTVRAERRRITDNLRQYDTFEVFDSGGNFVLFDAGGADKRVYTALAEQGVSVRKLGKIGRHEGCLRVTVGTREMNSKFLLAVRDLLG